LAKKRITTTQEVIGLEVAINRVIIQYPGFVDFTLRALLEDQLIKVIHQKMRADGIDQKIIDATFLSVETERFTGTIRYYVISNYNVDTENGKFPVAVFIEEGRRAYIINAPEPTSERPNPHLKFEDKEGRTQFRKSVRIPRFIARKYVENTIQERAQIIQSLFTDAQKQFLSNNNIPIN